MENKSKFNQGFNNCHRTSQAKNDYHFGFRSFNIKVYVLCYYENSMIVINLIQVYSIKAMMSVF